MSEICYVAKIMWICRVTMLSAKLYIHRVLSISQTENCGGFFFVLGGVIFWFSALPLVVFLISYSAPDVLFCFVLF